MTEDSNNLLNRAVGEAKTISSEISDYTKQRFSHPLFLSLIISFVVYNWRPISIFLFSKQPVEQIVEHLYSYDNKGAVWSPVFAAVLYTLTFPFLRNGIGWLLKWATYHEDSMRHRRNIGLAVFKEKEAGYEYKIATKRSGTNEITAMQTVIEEKDAMISSLKSSINAATLRSADLETQTHAMEERLLQNYLSKVEQGKEAVNDLGVEAQERRDALLRKFNAILEQNEKLLPNDALEVELMAVVEVMNNDEREWVLKTVKQKTFKSGVPIRSGIVNILLLRSFFLQTVLGYMKTPKFQLLIKKVNDQALWDSVHPQL